MAESNFSPPVHNPFSMPNPPGPHAQTPETSAPPIFQPSFGNYTTFYESSAYHHYQPSPFGANMAAPNQSHSSPFHYVHQNRAQYHQFPPSAGHRAAGYYPVPADMFPSSPPAASPQAPAHFHSLQVPGSPHSDFADFAEARNNSDLLPMIEPAMPSGQAYTLPPYSQLSPPPMHGFSAFPGRRPGPVVPTPPAPPSGRFSSDAIQSVSQGRGPMRSVQPGNSDQPHHVSSPDHRPSYDRQHQHVLQTPGGPDRRPQPFLSAHNRRSDRSVSPRTSHRRSFDRYSTDLPNSSTSSDAEEATRARIHRARQHRQRAMMAGSEFRRASAFIDGNTPTSAQMQALKDKLRHFLPSELPKGSSPTCDICQKDYSTKHVLPTDDEEVAIQLPCKHVFGEHCINTWFETCKTHKNKITCPMCRKLLVEPLRGSAALLTSMPEMMALFSRSLDPRTFNQLSQLDRQGLERFLGPMGGDLPDFA